MIERFCFSHVEHPLLDEKADTTDTSVKSDADAASAVVGFGSDDGRAVRSMDRLLGLYSPLFRHQRTKVCAYFSVLHHDSRDNSPLNSS